eukprot:UN14206
MGFEGENPAQRINIKNRVFVCKLCGWAYSNKYAPKVKEHSKECPSMFIFNNWQPQKLEALQFMKS